MAVNAYTLDRAEYTLCYDTERKHRRLGWTFMRVGDVGEERQYVVPVSPQLFFLAGSSGNGLGAPIDDVVLAEPEYMPDRPFPLNGAAAPRSNAPGDANVPGPVAVHYFGRL